MARKEGTRKRSGTTLPALRQKQEIVALPRKSASTEANFPHPVELKLWTTHNSTSGIFPVFANVVVSPIPVDAGGRDYKLFIRSASLQLRIEGAREPDGHVRYRHELDADEVRVSVSRHISSDTKSGYGAEVKAQFVVPYVTAGANASAANATKQTAAYELSATLRFMLVEQKANMGWRIGDERLGDIRKDNGFLDGPYLTGEHGNGAQICTLQGMGDISDRCIVGTITVSESRIHVVPDGGDASDPGLAGEAKNSVAEAFKDRLRSIKLMNAFDRRNEFTLARTTMRLPDSDET